MVIFSRSNLFCIECGSSLVNWSFSFLPCNCLRVMQAIKALLTSAVQQPRWFRLSFVGTLIMHEVHFLALFAQSSLRHVTCSPVLMFPSCLSIALIFAIHELFLWHFIGSYIQRDLNDPWEYLGCHPHKLQNQILFSCCYFTMLTWKNVEISDYQWLFG
jgi:hypothetical protein